MTKDTLHAGDSPVAPTPRYRPDWLKKPTGEDVAWAYPEAARRKGLDGRANIQCDVAPDGRLAKCKVISESPVGEGFGAAALAIAPQFQMTRPPSDAVGPPPQITVPLVFMTPKSETAPSPFTALKPLAEIFSPNKIRDAGGHIVGAAPLEGVLLVGAILVVVAAGIMARGFRRGDGKDLSGPNSEHR